MHASTRGAFTVLLAIGLASATGAGSEEPPPFLRYVTLNLFHGGVFRALVGEDRDLEERLPIIVDELRALGPDVLAVQEASVSPTRGHVARRLAAQLGLHFVYAPALRVLGFAEGPAILSRFPVLAWEVYDLPRCGRLDGRRVLLYAELGTPWGALPVFSTHTSGEACQSRHIAELVRARVNGVPVLLLGDFNAVEGSPPIAALTGAAGLIDVFRAANPTEAGATDSQRTKAPNSTVTRRIDYLFLLPGTAVPGRILGSRVVLNAPRRRRGGRILWPSDHYGVLAEVDVLRRPAEGSAEARE